MDIRLVHTKIKIRLNKLDSGDYDNISCYLINEAFNKAQKEWCRRQIHGNNQTREGSEQTKQRVSDLQILLKDLPIKGTNYKNYFETVILPKDILRFEKIQAIAKTKECTEGKPIDIDFVEEGNAPDLLKDWSTKPSFEWAETFNTVLSNKVRVYTSGEFSIDDATITYYRQPKDVSIENCEDILGIQHGNVDPEFADDVVELLIDETVSILAGDIESFNTMQTAEKRKELNN